MLRFKVFVENLERLRSERCPSLSLLGRLAADEVGHVVQSVLVAFLRLGHPLLQHRLDLLSAFRRDV